MLLADNLSDVKQHYMDCSDDDYVYSHKHVITIENVQYNRKVLTETGSRTTGLLFNVQVLYQLSYHDPTILLSRLGSRPNYPSVEWGL